MPCWYDRVLIVEHHVWCPDKTMARDFLNFIDSFNLVQAVSGPTQERGRTLDLAVSKGLNFVTLCFLIICLCLRLLWPIIQLNLPLLYGAAVSSLTLPLLFSSQLYLTKIALFPTIVPESCSVHNTDEFNIWSHFTCKCVVTP